MTDTPTPPAGATSPRVLVILNARAGTLARQEIGADELRAQFAAHGMEADVQSAPGDEMVRLARAGVEAGVRCVVAGGGDGTIATVASALVGGTVPLGVLSLGTRNHFARDLGIAVPVADGVRIIGEGHTRTIDVGEVNGRIFINNSSLGLYPQIVQERDEQRLRFGRAKTVATLWATINVLKRFWLMRVRVDVGGHAVVRTTPFVFIGNNEYKMDLFSRGARESLQEGTLSLYTTHTTSRRGLVRLAFQALAGRLSQADDFEQIRVQEAWLETKRPLVRVALDGEVVPMTPPLHYRIRPAALHVYVPGTAP